MNAVTLNVEHIYADDWTHPNQIEQWRRKSKKCAEVLVLDKIPVDYISGAYVVSQNAAVLLLQAGFSLPVEINTHLFFR